MKNKPLKIITMLVMVIIFSMTLGYSVLVQKLEIMGNAKIEAKEYLIEITSITLSKKEGEAYQNANPTFNKTEGTMYSSIPNTSSGIIYKITIKNKGLTSGVLDHTYASIDNSNIKYKIGGINNGDIIAAGESVDVTVEFEPWDDVTNITTSQVSSIIDFEFIPYNDSYSNSCTLEWDGTTSTEPTKKTIYGVEYYQISNANELNWFTNAVNNGSKDINGMLTKNICLNSKSLSQIGTDGYNGIFDGQNRTIQDFKFYREYKLEQTTTTFYTGLFKKNYGSIKNLNLKGDVHDSLSIHPDTAKEYRIYANDGTLVSENYGKISNCSYSGKIIGDYEVRSNCHTFEPRGDFNSGGMVGINEGVITGSYSNATTEFNATNTKNACNYGSHNKSYYGGIVGLNKGYISDTYFNGTISSSNRVRALGSHSYYRIGGIVGSFDSGTIKNSYNTAKISYTSTIEKSGEVTEESIGAISGTDGGTVTNSYYIDSVGYTGAGTIVSANDLSNLNITIGNYYFKDNKSINGGYPILKWQR